MIELLPAQQEIWKIFPNIQHIMSGVANAESPIRISTRYAMDYMPSFTFLPPCPLLGI
jgi:hypothetical protein